LGRLSTCYCRGPKSLRDFVGVAVPGTTDRPIESFAAEGPGTVGFLKARDANEYCTTNGPPNSRRVLVICHVIFRSRKSPT